MQAVTATSRRLSSIDLLRGIVMVIMALDHVRDFFHYDASLHSPLDLATTTPMLFFTRFITHYCAPVFLFLAGTSAFLMKSKRSTSELSGFLIKRGLWLIFVEVALVSLAITFNPFYNALILQVIWAIGISMVLLGLLIGLRIPYTAMLVIGCIIVFGHNLLDYPEAANAQKVGFWWNLLHHGFFSFYPYAGNHGILIVYAFLPWTGIMIMGYCAGKLFVPTFEAERRIKILRWSGIGMVALFVMLRLMNGYGNPLPWSVQNSSMNSFLSFINVNKYPPSLMYICITLGPALIFLSYAENISGRVANFFKVFGQVPLFYYVIHFFVIHFLTVIAFFLSGRGTKEIYDPASPFLFRPQVFGYELWIVYLVWFLVIAIMYPLCIKYRRYKQTHSQWWLSYM